MKNLLKKTAYILLSAAVFAFAACDTSVEDAPVIARVEPAAKESENADGKAYLSVSVNENPARMISPTDITQAGITRTELLAKASGAESSSLVKTWQSDAEKDAITKMTGDTDILIDAGTYDFTLNLYAGGTLCQTGTLLDVAVAAGNNPLAFSTKYAENGKGSLSITLTWTESERVSSVKAGLFTIASLGEESADGYAFSEIAVTTDEGSIYSATYAKDKVTNGAYFIRFELYATDGTKLNTLEDIVQIATACSTQKTIPLSNVNTLYAISYEKNGGDWAEGFTPTEKHNANTAVVLPEEAHIAKKGYEFAGWYTSEDGGETLSENALLAVSAGTAADVAVYAKWTPAIVKYTVKHLLQNADDDDYTEAEDDRETLYGKTESETVAVAKEYEHFTAKDIVQATILPDGSTIVEIKYDREVFTVTYFNGGTEIASQSVRYEGKASGLDAPADSSRNFAGWYISTDSGATLSDAPFNFADEIIANVALYAKWGVVADASNVAEKIASMTKSGTVIVKGSISNDTLTAIRDAINKKNFGIEIDLSEATGLTSIGTNAFKNCTRLTSITIPSSVTSISSSAFSGCSGLTEMIIPFVGASVDATGSNALFGYIFGTSSYTGGTVTEMYYSSGSYTKYYIPSALRTVKVTGGELKYGAFYNCSGLTSVIIPDSVTSIGNYAFYNCSGLTSVIIPDSVTSIGNYAFSGCRGLTSVIIPDSVTSMGYSAFSRCSGLTEMTIPFVGASADATGSNAIFGYIFGTSSYTGSTATNMWYSSGSSTTCTKYYIPSALRTVKVTGGELKYGAFYNCSGLTSVIIPDSVTSIGNYAFYNCSGLTSVIIPDSVTSIGNYAFYNCSGLTSVIIPDSVTSIESSAFSGCRGLTSITIPESVTSIGSYAFSGCSGLLSVTIPDSVTSIGDGAFSGCSGLTEMTIPFVGASADATGSNAIFGYIFGTSSYTGSTATKMYSSGSYTKYYIPSALRTVKVTGGELKYGAFYNCSGLTSVAIGDGVTSIESSAFYGCSGLTEMTIPFVGASADATGSNALFGYIFGGSSYTGGTATKMYYSSGSYATCYIPTALRTVKVTGGELKYGAFYGSELTSVIISDSVTSIGDGAFSDCRWLTSITIPESVTSIGSYAFSGCSGLTSVAIGDGVTSIESSAFYRCSGLTSVTIPDSVTSIGSYAFSGCSRLTSVTIPDSVTSIGSYAFSGCSGLTSVTIPDSVTSIGSYAFSGCSELTSVIIPDSVTDIGTRAFSGCSRLINVTIPESVTSIGSYAFSGCSGLLSVTIPDSVTSIGEWAFDNCSGLLSVTIPDSVTSIGRYAFSGCSGLESITFAGTVAQWNAISKGFAWKYNVTATKVVCSDGEVEVEL